MDNVTIGPPGTGSLPTASTIDGVNDYLPIYTNSAEATQAISRNTFLGLASAPVGLTDTQTLINKTIDTTNSITQLDSKFILQNSIDPTKQAVFGLSEITSGITRTYKLPNKSDDIVCLTTIQTLTNKTLTSPSITSPVISNATITADAITGYTSSDTGSLYGISVSSSNLSLPGTLTVTGKTILSSTVTTGGFITGTPPVWQYLGSALATSNSTNNTGTPTQVTGLSVTVTVPSGFTKVKISISARDFSNNTATAYAQVSIWRGAVNSGTEIGQIECQAGSSSGGQPFPCSGFVLDTPSVGSVTYNAGIVEVGGGTASIEAGSGYPMTLLVEGC